MTKKLEQLKADSERLKGKRCSAALLPLIV
jgi:hypothetical protein